jgi:putative PIN family toxin of toxin-antitoxin system
MIRAVVDTNVFIRAIIKPLGTVAPILTEIVDNRFVVCFSISILEELIEKLMLPRIKRKYHLTDEHILTVISLLITKGEFVESLRDVFICRDPDDNKFIEAALEANAQFVVSGDSDLLDLVAYESVRFVTPREFLEYMNANREENN